MLLSDSRDFISPSLNRSLDPESLLFNLHSFLEPIYHFFSWSQWLVIFHHGKLRSYEIIFMVLTACDTTLWVSFVFASPRKSCR